MKIGLIITATNKYIKFMPKLYDSYKKHFFKGHDRKVFLFTDNEFVRDDVEVFKIEHQAWPLITLNRFHRIIEHEYDVDYLFWMDADNLFVGDIGEEVLGDLIGTLLQGFIGRTTFTFEKRPESTACCENDKYFTGCFWGGRTERILEMANTLKTNIDADNEKGIVAIWQDESHLNRYFKDNPPDKILGGEYNNWYKNGWTTKPFVEVQKKDLEEMHK